MDERLRRTAQDIIESEHPTQQTADTYLIAVVEEAIQRKIKKNTLGVSRNEFARLLSEKEKAELLRMLAGGKHVPQPQASMEPEPLAATTRKSPEPAVPHPERTVWVLGSFFLLLFIVIFGSLAIAANALPSYLIIPVIIVAVILVVAISTIILVAAGILDQSIYPTFLEKLTEWFSSAQTKKS